MALMTYYQLLDVGRPVLFGTLNNVCVVCLSLSLHKKTKKKNKKNIVLHSFPFCCCVLYVLLYMYIDSECLRSLNGESFGDYSFFILIVSSNDIGEQTRENFENWIVGIGHKSWHIINQEVVATLDNDKIIGKEMSMLNEIISKTIIEMPIMDEIRMENEISSEVKIGIFNQVFSFTLLNSDPKREYMFDWDMSKLYQIYLSSFFDKISNIIIYEPIIDSQILFYGHIIGQAPSDETVVSKNTKNTKNSKNSKKNKKSTKLENNIKTNINFNFEKSVTKYEINNSKYFYITDKHLQTFVGSTDWNRISTLSKFNDQSDVNFIVYIPPRKYRPLHLHRSNSNSNSNKERTQRLTYDSFIVPNFGGVTIYNPTNDTIKRSISRKTTTIDVNELNEQFSMIVSQLRAMLGLKNIHFDKFGNKNKNENENRNDGNSNNINYLFDSESGLNDWELDLLIRDSIIRDLNSIYNSLENIHEIIDSVSELPIDSRVSNEISNAVHAFNEALSYCKHGNYIKCIKYSRFASDVAFKAEYDESMLPALYFSAEFTYAVYSPYFLPGYIPIVAALIKVE